METKHESLKRRAQGNSKYKCMSLISMITEEYLSECYGELKKNKASGIDGVSVEEYGAKLDENLKDLIGRMKAWKYRPQAVRRVYIPKSNGGKRGLGIPSVEDKVVQAGVKKILEAIFEGSFEDVSYGFRPKRSCHDALNKLDKIIMTKPVNYVVEVDIEKFFDTIDHKWLMRCLEERIADKNFLRLMGRFLRGGILEDGKYIETTDGTPQGGIISPILANIYLHYVLDIWFERVVKKSLKGYAGMVRYADDFIVCFEREYEATNFLKQVEERFAKFGLKVSASKTRVIEFGRRVSERAERENKNVATFDFLGFTHFCDKTRKGKFKLGRKTAKGKYREKLKSLKQWLKSVRNAVKLSEWWKVLMQKLTGHYRYYGVSGNMQSLKRWSCDTYWLIFKWINRRSQKKSYSIERFNRYLEYNPMPRPKIYHDMYTLSSK